MTAAPLYFASEPQTIVGHQWRVVVTDSKFGGRRFAYQFASVGELPIWREQHEWPGYTLQAISMGLPRALALLFEANVVRINDALEQESIADLLWA